MQIYGPRMGSSRGGCRIDLFQLTHVGRLIQQGHRPPSNAADTHRLGRIATPGEVPAVLFGAISHKATFLQLDHGLNEAGTEANFVRAAQGIFVGRAQQMLFQDIHVVRVDQGVLVRTPKQLPRMPHIKLVQRVVQANEHCQ